jgi:hypothetical protein
MALLACQVYAELSSTVLDIALGFFESSNVTTPGPTEGLASGKCDLLEQLNLCTQL